MLQMFICFKQFITVLFQIYIGTGSGLRFGTGSKLGQVFRFGTKYNVGTGFCIHITLTHQISTISNNCCRFVTTKQACKKTVEPINT